MSSFIGEILENIADYIDDEVKPYADVVFGSDPPVNGICMIQGAGAPTDTHLDKGMVYRLPVVLNGKNASQELVLDDLTAIHAALTRKTDYSALSTDTCQIVDIATTAAPSIIGREQDSQWICGSSFEVSFYWRMED
jgi:hypothetical protein